MPFTDQEYFEVIEKNEIVKKLLKILANLHWFAKTNKLSWRGPKRFSWVYF